MWFWTKVTNNQKNFVIQNNSIHVSRLNKDVRKHNKLNCSHCKNLISKYEPKTNPDNITNNSTFIFSFVKCFSFSFVNFYRFSLVDFPLFFSLTLLRLSFFLVVFSLREERVKFKKKTLTFVKESQRKNNGQVLIELFGETNFVVEVFSHRFFFNLFFVPSKVYLTVFGQASQKPWKFNEKKSKPKHL